MIATAVASIVGSLPGLAAAQAALTRSSQIPAAEYGINQQLDQLSARVDREVGRCQLSQTEAVDALRDVSSIQDAADADREENGGQLTVPNRLEIQARIDHLKAAIRQERTSGGTAPTH